MILPVDYSTDMQRTNIIERPELHNRAHVFRDREDAGKVLSQMMEEYKGTPAIVMAIPAGGLPVGAKIAKELALSLDVAVASKVTLPWNTEAGYGAVAFDGTVRLNDDLVKRLNLSEQQVEEDIVKTRAKVRRPFRLVQTRLGMIPSHPHSIPRSWHTCASWHRTVTGRFWTSSSMPFSVTPRRPLTCSVRRRGQATQRA